VAQKKAYEREASTGRVPGVRFATVHSSQGSESDIVVLDLVVAPGRGRSRFMDETRTPEFPNLLNVAISRARRQLFLVAHESHVAEHYPGRLLERMLGMVRVRHEVCAVPEDLRMQPLLARVVRPDHPAAV
jgi:superfamily I DNA/RNA helicase